MIILLPNVSTLGPTVYTQKVRIVPGNDFRVPVKKTLPGSMHCTCDLPFLLCVEW